MANDVTNLERLTELYLLIKKPIPWDPASRFIREFRDILAKEQVYKLAGIQTRLQAEALKIQKEYDAKISDIQAEAATQIQKIVGSVRK